MRLSDSSLGIVDSSWDYASQSFALRRPIPCPPGVYCGPGTAVSTSNPFNFSTPQPCAETMYCPEGSTSALGFGQAPPGYYSPYGMRLPCPAGAMCPYAGTLNPFPCPPGTFNGMVGQLNCTTCPAGYICPGFGRIDPAICPPGYVCSTLGLASPNTLCPAGFYCPNGTVTSDPFRNDTTLRPYPCSPGTFCLAGTAYSVVKTNVQGYAQNCTAGFYCELASISAFGSGLCPPGFVCPTGTAVPIPAPRGYFAEQFGSIEATQCPAGYYAPTIQTVQCIPCPAGTSCENAGSYEPDVCPPGSYRSLIEVDGVSCRACPQGTWSKQWGLGDVSECIPCPSGVVCGLDGMTNPCSTTDLPTQWVPTLAGEGFFACNRQPNHVFGILKQPFSIVKTSSITYNEGPFIIPDTTGFDFPNSECFQNAQPYGSSIYLRMKQYYGPLFEITHGYKHQGYGTSTYNGHFNFGSRYIPLSTSSLYSASNNCTAGYYLSDANGVPVYYPGTCETDQICLINQGISQATICPEGYICPEKTTALTASSYPCAGGYVCGAGTTPDVNLAAPTGMYKELCPEGYYCGTSTGTTIKFRSSCPAGYFCPTGTYDPTVGYMASDALVRDLSEDEANPYYPIVATNVFLPGLYQPISLSLHDLRCFNGINTTLQSQYRSYIDSNGKYAEINLAVEQNTLCARDHKWKFVQETVNRQECNCMMQLALMQEVFRIWSCTEGGSSSYDCSFVSKLPTSTTSYAMVNWTNLQLLDSAGLPFLSTGVQLPHFAALADRYYRKCEAVASLQSQVSFVNINGTLILNSNCSSRPAVVSSAQCPVFCSFAEVKDWVEPQFAAQVASTLPGKLQGNGDRIDPFLFDLKQAVDMLDTYTNATISTTVDDDPFAFGPTFWTYFDWSKSTNNSGLTPLRMDVCQCESLLRCPNGTTSPVGSTRLDQCVNSGSTVLQRSPAVPVYHESVILENSRPILRDISKRAGGLPYLQLLALQQAVIAYNFTGLKANFSYGTDYQISVYLDCDPCPPTYKCSFLTSPPSCSTPSLSLQQSYGYNCSSCCSCLEKYPPAWLSTNSRVFPNLDDKHKLVSFTILALKDMNITVVFELLSALYIEQFPYLSSVIDMAIHTPSRSNFASPSDRSNRNTFLSMLIEKEVNSNNLALPLNLPMTFSKSSAASSTYTATFENAALLGSPQDISISFPAYSNAHALTVAGNYTTLSPSGRNLRESNVSTRYPRFNSRIGSFEDGSDLIIKHRRLRSQSVSQSSNSSNVINRLVQSISSSIERVIGRELQSGPGPGPGAGGGAVTGVGINYTALCLPEETAIICSTRISRGLYCLYNETVSGCAFRLQTVYGYTPATFNKVTRNSQVASSIIRDSSSLITFDASWWKSGDFTNGVANPFTFITLPYLPFFSNCDGYDSYMQFSDLIEENPNCQIVPYDNTVVVSPFPWASSLYPVGDTCLDANWIPNPPFDTSNPGITIFCTYEEDIFSSLSFTRWYEATYGTILWHLTQQALPSSIIQGNYDSVTSPVLWGRNSALKKLQGTDGLLPVVVTVYQGNPFPQYPLVPRVVTLQIGYYQRTKGTKQIAYAYMSFSEFCTVSNIEADVLAWAEQGVPACIPGDYSYALQFSWTPLWWLDILNYFQFSAEIYVTVYAFMGIGIIILGAIVYLLHYIFTRIKLVPTFKLVAMGRLIFSPPVLGVLAISIPVFILIFLLMLWWIYSASADPVASPFWLNFEQFNGEWINTSAPTLDSITTYRMGRFANSIGILGFILLYQATQLVVPPGSGGRLEKSDQVGPDEDVEDLIASRRAAAHGHSRLRKKKLGRNDSEVPPEAKSDRPVAAANTWMPLRWKRGHFMLLSLISIMYATIILQFSFSTAFTYTIYYIIVILKLVHPFIDALLRYFLREAILTTPIMALLQVVQFLVMFGAENFTTYLALFAIQLLCLIVERLYMEPLIKRFRINLPLTVLRIKLYYYKVRKIHRSEQETQEDEDELKQLQDEVALELDGVEPMLELMTMYSAETLAMLLQPAVQLLIYLFDSSAFQPFSISGIPDTYDIRESDVAYYTFFNLIIIPFLLGFDIFILHSLELLYGWKLYDYMSYLRFRYERRHTSWLIQTKELDTSISEPLRRIDLMAFSSQHYFILAMHTWGLILLMFTFQIWLYWGYNFSADWVFLVTVPIVIILCLIIKQISMLVRNRIRLWQVFEMDIYEEDEKEVQEVFASVQGSVTELQRIEATALDDDAFKYRFLDQNRNWMLANLKSILTPKTLSMFIDDGKTFRQYLQGIYNALQRSDDKEIEAIAYVQGADLGETVQVSAPSHWYAADAQRKRTLARLAPKSQDIASIWAHRARKNLLYKQNVRGILELARTDRCFTCDKYHVEPSNVLSVEIMDRAGKSYDPEGWEKLIYAFERAFGIAEAERSNPTRPLNPTDFQAWRRFFRANARLCMQCSSCANEALVHHREEVKKRASQIGHVHSDPSQHLPDPLPAPLGHLSSTRRNVVERVVRNWLSAARARLLGTKSGVAELSTYQENVIARSSEKRQSLSNASNRIALEWLYSAKQAALNAEELRSKKRRNDVLEYASVMNPTLDFHFGQGLRMEGNLLIEKGKRCDLRREEVIEGLNEKVSEIEDSTKVQMMNEKYALEISGIEANVIASRLDAIKEENIRKLNRAFDEAMLQLSNIEAALAAEVDDWISRLKEKMKSRS
jgi:hypothetical protein